MQWEKNCSKFMGLGRAEIHDRYFKYCRNMEITPWRKIKATYRRILLFPGLNCLYFVTTGRKGRRKKRSPINGCVLIPFFFHRNKKKSIIDFCMQILAAQFRSLIMEFTQTPKYKNTQ